MKRNKITTIIATLMLVLFAGCEKESTDNIHVSEITHQYPNFDALDYNTQWNVIAAAIYFNIAQEKTTNPNDKEECLNEALRMYAVSMTAATAAYEAALIGCGFSGPGVVGCVILASSTYGVAMAVAAWQYKRAVKRC